MVGLVAGGESVDAPGAPEGLGVAQGTTQEKQEREATPGHGAPLGSPGDCLIYSSGRDNRVSHCIWSGDKNILEHFFLFFKFKNLHMLSHTKTLWQVALFHPSKS